MKPETNTIVILILGVIGPFNSQETEEVASLLTLSKMNQISYGARGLSLGEKERYPYFVRVVSNLEYVTKVSFVT